MSTLIDATAQPAAAITAAQDPLWGSEAASCDPQRETRFARGTRERQGSNAVWEAPNGAGDALAALSTEVGVATGMLLTKAEQVSGGGACDAGLRLRRCGNVPVARGSLAAGRSSAEAVVASRWALFRRRRGDAVVRRCRSHQSAGAARPSACCRGLVEVRIIRGRSLGRLRSAVTAPWRSRCPGSLWLGLELLEHRGVVGGCPLFEDSAVVIHHEDVEQLPDDLAPVGLQGADR